MVQEVFAKYAQGYTVPNILDSLNARGILCRNGVRFTKKLLYKMLFRESYRGFAEHDGVMYDNIFPRIISEELWDRVQQRHKEEALYPDAVKNDSYLLSGKLYCGLCHKPMIGISGTSKTRGRKYYYYGCNRNRTETHCLMKMLNRTQIHNLVFNTIARVVANDDTILRIAKLIMEEHERGKNKNYALQMLESQKESTGRAITNIRRAIEAGIFDEQTKARLDELNLQMEQIENDIRRERARTRPDLEITEVIDFLRAQFYGDIQSDNIRRALLKAFIYAIIYDGERLIIIFNYKEEHTKEPLPEVEISRLMELANKKGVVIDKTAFFFIPEHFGVVKDIPKT